MGTHGRDCFCDAAKSGMWVPGEVAILSGMEVIIIIIICIHSIVGFQFPQQHNQQQGFNLEAEAAHRKEASGEITGIMAEQVSISFLVTPNRTDAVLADRHPEPN